MEVKDFTSIQFTPLLVKYTPKNTDYDEILAINSNAMLSVPGWKNSKYGPYIADLMSIEITFPYTSSSTLDARTGSYETDETAYTVICTTPKFLADQVGQMKMTEHVENSFICQLITIFSGEVVTLPPEMQISKKLTCEKWQYKITKKMGVIPFEYNGYLSFKDFDPYAKWN